ncbi:hypothetical protein HDV06_003342 [Boothiomyces sp. JEL0866]|nr:hypothetical protein HDV06_003342 [Boothiomyces sp. JEL0866]
MPKPKKKSGGKKGKKSGSSYQAPKFVPMPTHWPGKISSEDLFNSFAQQVRKELNHQAENSNVVIRVIQIGFKYHDCILELPKQATLFRFKSEIARLLHGNSVGIEDIIVFRKKAQTPAERLQEFLDNKEFAQRLDLNTKPGELPIGISNELICEDDSKSLESYFPEMHNFKMMPVPETLKVKPPDVTYIHDLRLNRPAPVSSTARLYSFEQVADERKKAFASHNTTSFRKPVSIGKAGNSSFFREKEKLEEYPTATFTIHYDIYPYIKIANYDTRIKKANMLLPEFLVTSSARSEAEVVQPKIDIKHPLIYKAKNIYQQKLFDRIKAEIKAS